MHRRAVGAIVLLTVAISGCASILEGRSQEIAVSTDPPGAECGFYREGGARIATVERTPGSAVIRKTRADIWIVCVKPGYQEAIYFNRSGGMITNVVAGILTLGISTAVDSSTGSDNMYQSPANIVLVPDARGVAEGPAVLPPTFTAAQPPGSYTQQVASRPLPPAPGRQGFVAGAPPAAVLPAVQASASRPPERPVVAPAPAPPPPPPPPPPAANTTYDGFYSGSVEALDSNVKPVVAYRRQFDIRVANGAGSGTVKHALCDEPGEVSFTIDSAGAIRGRANMRNTVGCTERMTTLEGRMEGSQMRLVLHMPGNPQLVMPKGPGPVAAAPVAAAPPAAGGRFDGAYSGTMELATGDLRQVWLRAVGTRATGSIRRLACAQPGLISISIASDGSISGSADVLSGSCQSNKATVQGQISGTRMALTLVFPDGQASREFVFTRRSYD
jgi:hypothetical protein